MHVLGQNKENICVYVKKILICICTNTQVKRIWLPSKPSYCHIIKWNGQTSNTSLQAQSPFHILRVTEVKQSVQVKMFCIFLKQDCWIAAGLAQVSYSPHLIVFDREPQAGKTRHLCGEARHSGHQKPAGQDLKHPRALRRWCEYFGAMPSRTATSKWTQNVSKLRRKWSS